MMLDFVVVALVFFGKSTSSVQIANQFAALPAGALIFVSSRSPTDGGRSIADDDDDDCKQNHKTLSQTTSLHPSIHPFIAVHRPTSTIRPSSIDTQVVLSGKCPLC
jgi:hypothetical protein